MHAEYSHVTWKMVIHCRYSTDCHTLGVRVPVRQLVIHQRPLCCAFLLKVPCVVGCFDLLTTAYMRSTKKEKAGVGIAAAAGIVSCVLGSSISFPLETVARRLQVGVCRLLGVCVWFCLYDCLPSTQLHWEVAKRWEVVCPLTQQSTLAVLSNLTDSVSRLTCVINVVHVHVGDRP